GAVVESRRPPTGRQAANVRPFGIGALEVLVGDVALLVPVLLLGDAEVHEGLVPDVCEAHYGGMLRSMAVRLHSQPGAKTPESRWPRGLRVTTGEPPADCRRRAGAQPPRPRATGTPRTRKT